MLNHLCLRKYKLFAALNEVHVGPNSPYLTSLYLSPAPAQQDLPPGLLHTVRADGAELLLGKPADRLHIAHNSHTSASCVCTTVQKG